MKTLIDPLRHLISLMGDLIRALIRHLDGAKPSRIMLLVSEVRFMQTPSTTPPHRMNIALDLPAPTGGLPGVFARLVIKPVDTNQKPATLDGPVTVTVQDDITQTTQPTATFAIGPDGLTVDIQLPDTADAQATVEIDGDPNPAPGVVPAEVLTTLVTLRRLGVVTGPAVDLGVVKESVTLLPADQFGVFSAPPVGARRK